MLLRSSALGQPQGQSSSWRAEAARHFRRRRQQREEPGRTQHRSLCGVMNADMNGNEESPPAAHGVGQDTAPLEEETPEEFDIPMFSQQQERLQPMDLGGYSYDLNSRVAATTTAADQADGPSTSGQPPAQQSQQHPPRPRVNTRRTGQAAGRGSQAASAAHNGGGAGGAASLAAASARAPAGSGSGRSSRGKIFSDPVHKTFRCGHPC